MRTTNTQGGAPPAGYRRPECCTDAPCDSGLRNQYFEGKRLTADSFRVEQDYALERRRLANRAIHGWGVVYGYALTPVGTQDGHTRGGDANEGDAKDWGARLQVGPGLALDECGRELLQTRRAVLDVGDTTLFDGKGARIARPPEGSYTPRGGQGAQSAAQAAQGAQACWLLRVHYAEQLVGPVKLADPCSCERNEWDHVCETVRFSLRQVDCDACCAPFDCELACGCGSGPCCKEQEQEKTQAQSAGNSVRRGACGCLCEHLTGLSDSGCGGLVQLDDPCAQVRADLYHGVPLACVRLREGECEGEWLFEPPIDACGPRRLVKGNEVLFDLLRGCDLTRISAIGWADWHRSRTLVEWDDFEASFGMLDGLELERMRRRRDRHETFPVVTVKYWVEFSRPVREGSVRADCFSMTVLRAEDEGGWTVSYRVPILKAETSAPPGTPAGLASRAVLVVDARWLYDAVRGSKTIFDEDPITVEIEIRGDLIVDCNGQAVDANAHGLFPAPSGNGTPGGTFFSSFQVQPRFAGRRIADDRTDRTEGVES